MKKKRHKQNAEALVELRKRFKIVYNENIFMASILSKIRTHLKTKGWDGNFPDNKDLADIVIERLEDAS